MDPSSPSSSGLNAAALQAFEQQLQHLQARATDLKTWTDLEQIPPTQWAEMQTQLQELEDRMQGYLLAVVEEINQPPAAFWQAVRFGGMGILLGILLQRWLG
jgi:hypothetical protein